MSRASSATFGRTRHDRARMPDGVAFGCANGDMSPMDRRSSAPVAVAIGRSRTTAPAAATATTGGPPRMGEPPAQPPAHHGRASPVNTGALVWPTTSQGIPLLPSGGPARTAALLVTHARQQQRGWRGPAGVIAPKAPTPREQRLAVPATLPGVCPVLAARLLDHFGRLRGGLDADAEALGAVPDIGE